MFTEELLSEVETLLRNQNPKGVKKDLSEIFVRSKDGVWISKTIRRNNPAATKKDMVDVGYAITALGIRRQLSGVVHVHVAHVVGDANIKDVLMLSGSGPTGRRMRVYKLADVDGLKQTAGLVSAFDVKSEKDLGGLI